jgi:hypothetical protein
LFENLKANLGFVEINFYSVSKRHSLFPGRGDVISGHNISTTTDIELNRQAMKNLIATVLLLIAGIVVNAQDTTVLVQPPVLPQGSAQEMNRQKIQVRDLPDAVKESLNAADYAGWTVEEAFKAKITDPQSPESEGIDIYIVNVTRKDERATLRFDKDGKRLDDDD